MKYSAKILLGIIVIAAAWARPLAAQNEPEENTKINSNLGLVINVPLGSTADIIHTGWGIDTGVGYNFNRRNAVIPEFMWNRVYANTDQLQPLLLAVAQGAGGLKGTTDLVVLSGNYRFELRGKLLGAYLIGGGGWYHLSSNLSRTVTSGTATTCTPVWLWWGFTCSSGVVTTNQTIASASASAWGGNVGAGFTVRVGDAPYRLYFESRYHYVPHQDLHTSFMQVTLGIRY
jgi:outer membrane protein with beta-barrel domain